MIYFWIGFNTLALVFVFTFLGGLLVAPIAVLISVLIGDTVDYMVEKTRIRSEGIAFAAFTFSNKASAGFAAWAAGMVLAVNGYTANQAQSTDAVLGMVSRVGPYARQTNCVRATLRDLAQSETDQFYSDSRS